MTWRAAALLAVGALTLPGWPAPFVGVAVMVGVVLLLVGIDLALAAPLRALTAERAGERAVRLGGTATVTLYLRNSSSRPLRAGSATPGCRRPGPGRRCRRTGWCGPPPVRCSHCPATSPPPAVATGPPWR
ncbi:hypothetical protein GCM10029963_36400 [Micromonospora andamanensis]